MNTKALRQKILDLAIHGKLVPQDPNDEPASVLLERIRAEKERLIKDGKIKKPKKSKATCDKPPYPFQLPEGWVWCNITEVTNKITDGTHNSPINTPKGDFKYITAKNIKAHGIELDNISYVSQEVHSEIYARCNPEKGDILYIKDGATTGIVTINNLDEQFSLLSSVALIKPNKSISNKYLLYYLQSSLCYDSVRESMKGVGITRITLKQIEKWVLPLPPLAEQERIVCQIEKWFSLIDAIEKGNENLNAVIKQAKSKILDLAIHGKLVPQDPNDEPASDLLKHINPKAEIICDNPRYGKLPSGWCVCHIPDIANSLLGKTLDRSKNTGNPKDYLCAINVLWGKFDLTTHKTFLLEENEYERYTVKKGDLMVCEGGDVGRCAIWEDASKEMYYQNALHRIRCKEGIFNYYIQFLLWHYKLNGTIDYLCKGVTIKHFTQTVMNKLDILLPPFEEQKRIVAKIEELFAQLGKIEASL